MPRPAVKALLRISAAAFAAAAMLFTGAVPALAHAFGQRYDLPLPLGLYLLGAGAAVGLSFVVMVLFFNVPDRGRRIPGLDLLASPIGRVLAHPALLTFVRALAVASFVLIIAAGFLGTQSPTKNIAPTTVWVIWWVGMAYVSALVGNLWALINPWAVLFSWAEVLYGRLRPGRPYGAGLPYPARLGAWPAVALFLGFAWMEIVSERGDDPTSLATAITVYSVITWAGMVAFGRETWLRHGEAFAVVFGLLARFAPTEAGTGSGRDGSPRWRLRPPGVGLLTAEPVAPAMIGFVLLMLATVTFDGFIETPAWKALLDGIATSPALRSFLLWLLAIGVPDLLVVIKTVALVVFPLLFAAAFLLFSNWMAVAGEGVVPTGRIAGFFVLSLVPIAIAYHLAHYLSFLLLAGQLMIPLVSDPFGFGWDLFGTAAYALDISVINAKFAWYVSVTAIVTGHVFAVYLAHVTAFRVFDDPWIALKSQVPMLVLMVGYTMISLWILAQPVVSDAGLGVG